MSEQQRQHETDAPVPPGKQADASARGLVTTVYALQAAGIFLFLITLGITFLVAGIITHTKKKSVEETWLASHFRWQTRTFWYGLLWTVIGLASAIYLIGFIILIANGIWVTYRVVRGWLDLIENKPMYMHKPGISKGR